jgi:RNA polymerase sigma-70 factor (ECF subfamily)
MQLATSNSTVTDFEPHRVALFGHCYRMLGSSTDAEDAVQEVMLRAWRARADFDGRSSLRHWLHRIATNVCFDSLASRKRRTRPVLDGPEGSVPDGDVDGALEQRDRVHWIEPVPDAKVLPTDVTPDELVVLRQSVRLAFVAALQHLTPRQRAALLLTEVLGWSVAETAQCLGSTSAAINSALQRARATMSELAPAGRDNSLTVAQSQLVDRYVAAFERYDVDSLLELFRDDATLSMPPYRLWLRGRENLRRWLLGPGRDCRGSKLVRTCACASPAMGQYRPSPGGGYHAWALAVLETEGDRVIALNSFLDVERLFPMFRLPMTLSG